MSTTLKLSGLSAITPARALHHNFSAMGPILLVRLHHDEGGELAGTATIVFENEASATRAFHKFDQQTFDGRVINVAQVA